MLQTKSTLANLNFVKELDDRAAEIVSGGSHNNPSGSNGSNGGGGSNGGVNYKDGPWWKCKHFVKEHGGYHYFYWPDTVECERIDYHKLPHGVKPT